MGRRFDLNDYDKKSSHARRVGKRKLNKEKAVMLAASAAVLGVLTFTGVYLGSRSGSKDEPKIIDFSALERAAQEQEQREQAQQQAEQAHEQEMASNGFVDHNDMDVDPGLYEQYQQANSGDIINPGLESEIGDEELTEDHPLIPDGTDSSDSMSYQTENQTGHSTPILSAEEIADNKIRIAEQTLQFSGNDEIAWPITGNVIINYNMDGYAYFATLEQYRHSPAIVIAANRGEAVTSACEGIVSSVFYDEELGNAVTVILGSGYELTYGQLTDIVVKRGDYVDTGDLIGKVAEPTKYYSVEGSNVYFALTRNGEPVNPLEQLQ